MSEAANKAWKTRRAKRRARVCTNALTVFQSLTEKLCNLKPNLAVAFGSYLLNPSSARDLDILLISDAFEGVYYQHRRRLLPAKFNLLMIDAYCFTREEFRFLFVPDHPFIKAIRKNHLVLAGDFDDYF